jgi:hypothetical protein
MATVITLQPNEHPFPASDSISVWAADGQAEVAYRAGELPGAAAADTATTDADRVLTTSAPRCGRFPERAYPCQWIA